MFSSLTSCAGPAGDVPRFRVVETGKLYRSAQPNGIGYADLARAGIRTVVKLNTDQAAEERAWAKAQGVNLIEIPLPGLTAPAAADEERVLAALQNPMLQPVLVHCEQGQDRTGLAVALYRVRAQGWAPEAAHQEWRDLGHSPLLFGMDLYFDRVTK